MIGIKASQYEVLDVDLRRLLWAGAEPEPGETGPQVLKQARYAVVARVAVDRVTGMAQVIELDQHTAAGPVVDPPGYLGQFEGGNVQGLELLLAGGADRAMNQLNRRDLP